MIQKAVTKKRVLLRIRSGTYRDAPSSGGAGTIPMAMMPNGTTGRDDAVRVVGKPSKAVKFGIVDSAGTPVLNDPAIALQYVASDEELNVPPRLKTWLESATVFLEANETLPSLPATADTVTLNLTSNVITLAGSTPFLHNARVTLNATTSLPSGLSATAIYTLIKITATTYRLVDSAGLAVALGSGGSGTYTMATVDPVGLEAADLGFAYVLDSWEPIISNYDTRLPPVAP